MNVTPTKLLLIDDSRAILAKLSSDLIQQGFDIKTCTNAKSAIDELKITGFDCIICDYEMPEMNGPTFARWLKSESKHKHTPVIMMTSASDTEHLLKAIDEGADDFLAKSTPLEIMVAKIRAMLRIAQMRQELSNLRRVEGIRSIIATYNHEINNPLAIIVGYLIQLKKAAGASPELLEKTEKIAIQTTRIQEIVKKIDAACEFEEQDYSTRAKMIKIA